MEARPTRALQLPVDELGLEVLADLVATGEWNEYNYLSSASQDPGTATAKPRCGRSPSR